MLGKLLKYDMKNGARFFLPMYLIFAVIVLLTKLYILATPDGTFATGTLAGLISASYTFGVIGLVLLTEIFFIVYFYRKCISQEAYLTFTLPAKTGSHLLSKCIFGAIWHVCSYGLIFLSLSIFFSSDEIYAAIRVYSYAFSVSAPVDLTWSLIFLGLNAFIHLFASPLMYFASMAMGQIVTRHKVLASVGIYIGFYIVFSMASSFGSTFLYIGAEVLFSGDGTVGLTVLSAFRLILALIQAGLFYFLTYFFLDKK